MPEKKTSRCQTCNMPVELVETPAGADPVWNPPNWRHVDGRGTAIHPHGAVPAPEDR